MRVLLPQRKKSRDNRLRFTKLGIEALEERCVPAAMPIVWNGAAGGSWSAGGNWVGGVAPVNGDVAQFDPAAKDTDSADDITNLKLERLIVKAGYQSKITVNSLLSTNSSATIAGGKFLKGEQGSLTLGTATTTISTISLSDTSFTNLPVIIDAGMGTDLKITGAVKVDGLNFGVQGATTEWTGGGIELDNGATIQNSSVWSIQTNANLTKDNTNPYFINTGAGTLKKTDGASNRFDVSFSNKGNFSVNTAGITFTNSVTQSQDTQSTNTPKTTIQSGTSITLTNNSFFMRAGLLQGTGTITGNVINESGTVAPGIDGSAGLLTITGNYTQQQAATIQFYVGGPNATDYGRLIISGRASLAGTVTATLISGYDGGSGLTFSVMTFGSLDPDHTRFSTENTSPLGTNYTATAFNLVSS